MEFVMLGLIALLIFFMFRNGKKRQRAMQELQAGLQPGAEIMLQSGIFATVESIDEEESRVTVRSGDSSLVVHRNAVSQIIAPVDAVVTDSSSDLAPDDDPAFGERISEVMSDTSSVDGDAQAPKAESSDVDSSGDSDSSSQEEQPGENRSA